MLISESSLRAFALMASIAFILIPVDRSRFRAEWTNVLFVIAGIVGVLVTGTKLLLLLNCIVPSSETAGMIHQVRVLLCGFARGLISALILSRQLLGSKQSR